MKLRFYVDRDSGLPHVYNHGVREDEVEQVLRRRGRYVGLRPGPH